MLTIKVKGSTAKTETFLRRNKKLKYGDLDKYGIMGVNALREATPVDTGLTADSWTYEIVRTETTTSIVWKNTNVSNGVPIALLIQYGHGTRNGGYVVGRDYINPALQPIFDKLAEQAWLEVTRG